MGEAQTDTFWHLHPDWAADAQQTAIDLRRRDNGSAAITRLRDAARAQRAVGRGIRTATPRFTAGIESALCLHGHARPGPLPRTALTLIAKRAQAQRTPAVKPLPLTSLPGDGVARGGVRGHYPGSRSGSPFGGASEHGERRRMRQLARGGAMQATTDGRLAVLDVTTSTSRRS